MLPRTCARRDLWHVTFASATFMGCGWGNLGGFGWVGWSQKWRNKTFTRSSPQLQLLQFLWRQKIAATWSMGTFDSGHSKWGVGKELKKLKVPLIQAATDELQGTAAEVLVFFWKFCRTPPGFLPCSWQFRWMLTMWCLFGRPGSAATRGVEFLEIGRTLFVSRVSQLWHGNLSSQFVDALLSFDFHCHVYQMGPPKLFL